MSLAGAGASYLVAVELASGDGSADPVAYTVSVPATSVSDVVPTVASSPVLARAALVTGAAAASGAAPRAFDAVLRARGQQLAPGAARLAAALSSGSGAATRASASAAAPELGSARDFEVLATTDSHERYAPVSARLAYAGTNLLLYVDQAAPAGGFSAGDLAELGRYYDEVMYPLDVANFGTPSDIDQNGRLVMLLTPVVNAMVTKQTCSTQGYIGGFFNPNDLSSSASTSNRGEVFYALVPDPAGTRSCVHTVADTRALLAGTFLHETQHLISYSQHVLVNHGSAEAGWLDEGLSLVAEELGSIFYEGKYPGSTGRSLPGQLLPDSAQPFMANVLAASYVYLARPDTTSLTTHSDGDAGLDWRGGDWLLLRWLGDQLGGPAFYQALERTSASGIAAIEAAAHQRFTALFGDFALALFTDSLPGLPRGAVPARNTFAARGLRALYAGYRDGFPLAPRPLTGSSNGTLAPGSLALYRIYTTTSAASVTLRFSTPAGAPLPAGLKPQVAVFRMQD
ncbi:MAG TPA: hypothetical protein VF832_15115 [Longimicrobiales bacterium]